MASALLAAVLALLVTGCVETRTTHNSWDFLRGMADKPDSAWEKSDKLSTDPSTAAGVPNQAGMWSIELKTFEGEHASTQAQALVEELTKAGLTELWVLPTTQKATVYRGTYPSNASPRGQRDLEDTRKFRSGGDKLFASAALVLPESLTARATDPCDLKQYLGMYTLQIGYYDEEFGPNFREAAEEAVKVLRAQGEQAFYYHSPIISMVTVGLFTQDDRVTVNGVEEDGPRMRALQKRFPHHMRDGLAIMVPRSPGQSEAQFQETRIVGPID